MGDSQRGDIQYLKRGGELILFLSGEVTAPLAVALYEHLRPHLEAHDIDHVHIDLSRVSYVDSTTIGTFIKTHKVLTREHATLYLWNLSAETRRILSTMNLLEYFAVERDGALEELRASVLTSIPASDKDFITDEYVLEAHQDIVEAEPSLKPTFDPLITILRQRIEQHSSGRDESSG